MFEESLSKSRVETRINTAVKPEHLYLIVKRAADIVLSGIGLILVAPILLIVAVLIKLDSKGPVFLDQKRIGKDGKMFRIYKFRSMVDHAEDVLMELMENDPAIKEEYITKKKLENDPRVTKIGKFIRKTSIDELPQLINIFLGDMSLVGPRPYLAMEIEDMGLTYFTIIKMTPGLTGPWQVAGRSNIGFRERCAIDCRYYKERSLKDDFKIILKTFKVVLGRKGAK
ncbi:MAG: sugar transferase [Bacilli bacterium]|nr:sugar transferase [Bacilli bacterium]